MKNNLDITRPSQIEVEHYLKLWDSLENKKTPWGQATVIRY
jgi:hypothetical protein